MSIEYTCPIEVGVSPTQVDRVMYALWIETKEWEQARRTSGRTL